MQKITIAGILKDMLLGSRRSGADAHDFDAKTMGSILVNRTKVAGSSVTE